MIKASSQFEGDAWTYKFSLPANTTAKLTLPKSASDITLNGKALSALTAEDGVLSVTTENGVTVIEVVCGSFTLGANLK